MVNKFSKREARILVYGKEHRYAIIDCLCREDVEEVVDSWGKPEIYMSNFASWQDVAKAKKCYRWQVSALPAAAQNVVEPTDEELDWF